MRLWRIAWPQTQNGAGVATGPISGSGRGLSTPVGSQSGSARASSNRARSGIVRSKLLAIPSDFHEASPASVCRTSFRQAGDHPRTSFRQAGDCPFRLFSTGRTRYPDLQFLSGQALRFPSGLPSSKLSRRPFAIPLPESSGLAGLRKSGFGFGFPRCLALLPGCPTRASLASFPKDLRSLGTGGVWSFFPVAGWSLLTARGQNVRPDRFAQRESWAFCLWITWITGTSGPIPRQSADPSRVSRPRSSSQPIRIAQSACVP